MGGGFSEDTHMRSLDFRPQPFHPAANPLSPCVPPLKSKPSLHMQGVPCCDAPLLYASRSSAPCGSTGLVGVLPLSLLSASACAPPSPNPWDEQARSHMLRVYSGPADALVDCPSEPLRILSVNCGGLSSKVHLLLALLDYADPEQLTTHSS